MFPPAHEMAERVKDGGLILARHRPTGATRRPRPSRMPGSARRGGCPRGAPRPSRARWRRRPGLSRRVKGAGSSARLALPLGRAGTSTSCRALGREGAASTTAARSPSPRIWASSSTGGLHDAHADSTPSTLRPTTITHTCEVACTPAAKGSTASTSTTATACGGHWSKGGASAPAPQWAGTACACGVEAAARFTARCHQLLTGPVVSASRRSGAATSCPPAAVEPGTRERTTGASSRGWTSTSLTRSRSTPRHARLRRFDDHDLDRPDEHRSPHVAEVGALASRIHPCFVRTCETPAPGASSPMAGAPCLTAARVETMELRHPEGSIGAGAESFSAPAPVHEFLLGRALLSTCGARCALLSAGR